MAFIDQTDAASLIPQEVSNEIIKAVPEYSYALQLMKKLPNMSKRQRRIPVMASLATASFINKGTTATPAGKKPTTKLAWEDKFIDAEEIAAIIPVPEDIIEDADYDIWGECKTALTEAFGVAIDQAIFFGTGAPTSWPDDIITGATSAGNVVALGTGEDLLQDVSSIMASVESDGYDVTGFIAPITIKAQLRDLRDALGRPVFMESFQGPVTYTLFGAPIQFVKSGMWNISKAQLVAGDFQSAVYAIRQDITFKILTEGVIQDDNGDIIYNLAQQDMLAIRAVMRLGWQVPNPVNRLQPVKANRFPFGIIT
jgi:HK97 family phage major capsid protein